MTQTTEPDSKTSDLKKPAAGFNRLLKVLQILVWSSLLIFPPLLVLYLILTSVPNVPFADEWMFSPLLINFKNGGVTFNSLWAFHNEHRVVILRLVFLGLATVTGGWNIVSEVALSWLTVVATACVTAGLIWQTVQAKTVRLVLLPVASLMLFNLMQWENWIWGFQMAWFLVNLFSLSALLLLARYPGKPIAFGAALGLTWLATLTLASGFFFAFPIWLAFLFNRREWGWRYSLIWGVFFSAFLGIYIQGLQQTAGGGWFSKPLEAVVFTLAFVGAPLGADSLGLAATIGASGLILAGGLAFWLGWRKQLSWQSNLPWFVLIAFTVANALVAANGRVLLDIGVSLASRYVTISTLFWLALVVIVAQNLPTLLEKFKSRRLVFAGAGLTLAVLLVQLNIVGSGVGLHNIDYRTGNLRAVEPFLYDYSVLPDGVAELIFASGHNDLLKSYLYALDNAKEGLFKVDKTAYFNKVQEKWQHALEQKATTITVPAKPLTNDPKAGELLNLTTKPDSTLEFRRSGKLTTRLEIPTFLDLSPKRLDPAKPPVLEITTGTEIWYVQLEWLDGTTPHLLPLIPLRDKKDKADIAHSYTYLPEIALRSQFPIRVVIFYKTGRETPNSFKAVMHVPD